MDGRTDRRTDGWMDGRTDGCMDVRTDVQIFPVLQDFVSSGSLRSRCPKNRVMDARTYVRWPLSGLQRPLKATWGHFDFG